MGASLSLALKKKGSKAKVTGVVGSPKSKENGKRLGSADEIMTAEEFSKVENWSDYDLIVFGVPVDKTAEMVRALPKNLPAILTDLGSTKKEIVQAVEDSLTNSHKYISSHPMCGSEETGLEYANPDLYEGRLCILTKPAGSTEESFDRLEEFWKWLGMETLEIPSVEHDKILSYLSHVPHILSSLMADWAWENECVQKFTQGSPVALTGGGFRDMTRIAGSNPKMWAAIYSSNRDEIYKSLLDYRNRLDQLLSELDPKKPLDPERWETFMEESRKNRDRILKRKDDTKKN
ncbi:prephenate dehydrogenase [Leptospira perolatii]|uniref:prephenate dehydrogenase n=1 Tax=Leptospira perolatii TaxID=2023191 RepID=A0A2M9ZNN7_9LEPT|nr:prephenate dehydrogenase [Leptospira perolatii]PJZ68718.1 prephenate dehydrogenase [Leptospira perolatii]PJZ73686.1 prephenate dehydrogenase [Leptospira perolatii]